MQRKPVTSSNIVSIGHCPDTHVLEVEFAGRNGVPGCVYRYFEVPAAVHQALVEAPSVGSYFHKHVKSAYKCEKMEPAVKAAA
jgi:hypothetical protein